MPPCAGRPFPGHRATVHRSRRTCPALAAAHRQGRGVRSPTPRARPAASPGLALPRLPIHRRAGAPSLELRSGPRRSAEVGIRAPRSAHRPSFARVMSSFSGPASTVDGTGRGLSSERPDPDSSIRRSNRRPLRAGVGDPYCHPTVPPASVFKLGPRPRRGRGRRCQVDRIGIGDRQRVHRPDGWQDVLLRSARVAGEQIGGRPGSASMVAFGVDGWTVLTRIMSVAISIANASTGRRDRPWQRCKWAVSADSGDVGGRAGRDDGAALPSIQHRGDGGPDRLPHASEVGVDRLVPGLLAPRGADLGCRRGRRTTSAPSRRDRPLCNRRRWI